MAGKEPLRQPAVVRSAVKLLRSQAIVTLEIFYLPEELTTRGALDPKQLEQACFYRIRVEQFQYCTKLRRGLISALESSAVTPTTDQADLRWGCVFYNARKARVLAMYFGSFGKGMIGRTWVTTNGKVVEFLRSRCSCVWAGDYR